MDGRSTVGTLARAALAVVASRNARLVISIAGISLCSLSGKIVHNNARTRMDVSNPRFLHFPDVWQTTRQHNPNHLDSS
jgi:low affinity Fe/Cu permease